MAITEGAKKAIRQSKRKHAMNDARRKALREGFKAVRSASDASTSLSVNDKIKALAAAYKAIDKAAKRGLIKKNTAARRKAKVARALKV
ncbi:MAG: 30S ribosomal protein S20 [Minisyncoccia bacterium]|jgi:small subunit ribosomal protein S20